MAGGTWGFGDLAAQPAAQRAEGADRLQIERVGGVAGFGGSHLKGRGAVALSDLSVADRQTVEALFRHGGSAPPPGADRYSYRITRQAASGSQTVVVPENAVPASLKNSVKDILE
jgi:hypothetical protein